MRGMGDYDFERSFGFVLHETARLLSKRFDQQARRFGLTRAQCAALVFLSRNEGINQSGLAELLEMEPISLARLIDRMEQAGWVERRADPGDRRARLLYMTAKAKPVFDKILLVGQETRTEALAGLTDTERDHLIDLLLRVRGNLTQKGPVPTPAASERAPRRDEQGAWTYVK
jgi:DNA-binding MarR family transcriptional regulator